MSFSKLIHYTSQPATQPTSRWDENWRPSQVNAGPSVPTLCVVKRDLNAIILGKRFPTNKLPPPLGNSMEFLSHLLGFSSLYPSQQPPDQTSAHLSFLIHGSFCRSDLVIISFLLVFNFMLRSILIFLIPCRSSLIRPTPYQWIIFVFLAASASVGWRWWVQISFRQANTVIEQTRPVGCEYLSATWIMSKIYIYYISLHQSIW